MADIKLSNLQRAVNTATKQNEALRVRLKSQISRLQSEKELITGNIVGMNETYSKLIDMNNEKS